MEDEFGSARAFQQCGDDADTIDEAIDCCPVDCIHAVSFNELRILEQHRRRMMESGEMAAAQGVGKLSARAEGRDGARGATPAVRSRLREIESGTTPPHSGRVSPRRVGCTCMYWRPQAPAGSTERCVSELY